MQHCSHAGKYSEYKGKYSGHILIDLTDYSYSGIIYNYSTMHFSILLDEEIID